MAGRRSLPESHRECHGMVLPLTLENFAPHPTGRNGWHPRCRVCTREEKRAWRKGVKARPPLLAGQRCPECEGLAHRRPLTGCPRCKLAHVPETIAAPTLRKFDWAM